MSLISNPNHSEPSNRLQNRLGFCQAPHLRRYLIIPSHPLYLIMASTNTNKLSANDIKLGYVETSKTGLKITWEHCCYFIAGFLDYDLGIHVYRTARTLKEARTIARYPYSPAIG